MTTTTPVTPAVVRTIGAAVALALVLIVAGCSSDDGETETTAAASPIGEFLGIADFTTPMPPRPSSSNRSGSGRRSSPSA